MALPASGPTIDPAYLGRLMARMRGVQGREMAVDEDSGSNPTDDDEIDALQDTPGDLSREELREEIRGLDDRQQAELVALLWTGRGDAEAEDWDDTVQAALERRETPTAHYLMSEPLVAEYWAEGAERLGFEIPINATEERS